MRNVFRDVALQAQLDGRGYVVVPFLKEEEIKSLQDIYEDMFSSVQEFPGVYISIYNQDEAVKRATNFGIRDIVNRLSTEVLDRYKFVNSSFAIKLPGEESVKDLHQDLTSTDESKYVSTLVWIPLVDVDEHNGCMYVVEGSHEFFGKRTRQTYYYHPFEDIKEHIWQHHASPVVMKAGEALIFDARLIHGSKENESAEPRVCALNVMVPEESPVWLCVGEADNNKETQVVDVYEFKNDNYFLQNVTVKPDYLDGVSKIDTLKLDRCCLTAPEFDELTLEVSK